MSVRTAIAVTAVTALATVATAAPSLASATSETSHVTLPAAGSTFACQGGDLVVTSGTIDITISTTVDGRGVFHITGTIVPHDVVLADAAGTSFWLSGAQWFGGKATSPDAEPVVSTETDHFVVHHASGGVYAKVSAVTHVSPGSAFALDKGQCEQPVDAGA
ncbi:hypothetical protein [Phycicoccus duodecadis]|uniref:Uncharacterized protein n=1 Tax=Phycicoccus duodecadis TaxID=173053 RepID=A0A2N3YMA4_9MICO|nr:hypothetical protein [Phycicoccus duodecadis]PKW27990.1 hypothetical protein ATL31_2843 [Phycicoccus duodecadis]